MAFVADAGRAVQEGAPGGVRRQDPEVGLRQDPAPRAGRAGARRDAGAGPGLRGVTMVATIDAVLTRPMTRHRSARWPRSSGSFASSSARCGSFPGAALAVYRHGRSSSTSPAATPTPSAASRFGRTRSSPSSPATSRSPRSRSGSRSSAATRGLDDPVAAHWPAFGQNGKERVTGPACPLPPRRLPDDAAGAAAGAVGRLGGGHPRRSRPCRWSTSRARSAPTTS